LDLGSTAVGTAIASKAVILDSNKDYTGIRNLTVTGHSIFGSITGGGVIKTNSTTAATSTTDGSLQTDGGLSVVLDAVIGDDIIMISDAAQIAFGVNSEIALIHNHNVGLKMASTAYAPLARRGEDVFIVLDQTAAAGTDAGDNVIMDRSAAETDVGDDIIGEDEVFLHSGMQRNVLQIFGSGGELLNSVAGFAPGAI
jgi:hypothetical protein